ncbi:DUF6804 family protein [Rhizobium sp. BK399]|uniref:DUF6804 family protein n=1 Tax=Rhizobium sp. BK399 TaxID=2587063 RepID=UPI000DE22295|nr:DUF6804 family protein [Rhizobium sp. BK399]MBB3544112.1 putative membrane-bound mannosyltransferase [Rhizobium sp. BK399]
MNSQTRRYLLIPAGLLVLAVLPFPYGYYMFLRLVVAVASALTALTIYKAKQSLSYEVVALGLVALLFNPFIVVALSRLLWLPIDLAVAALLAYLALRKDNTARG